MVMEGNEVPNGWPLGLGSMNSRIRAADASQPAAPPHPYAARILRSSSFSSFSSSNLDTESTASFNFPGESVSLGRLIGIRPADRGSSYGQHHRLRISDVDRSRSRIHKGHENSHGLCAPLIHHVIGKMGRSGSTKRQ